MRVIQGVTREVNPPLYVVFSPRDLEITSLVARGLTNKQIATQLKTISPGTVQWRLHRIYQAMGMSSRWDLILWWLSCAPIALTGKPVQISRHRSGCACEFCREAA